MAEDVSGRTQPSSASRSASPHPWQFPVPDRAGRRIGLGARRGLSGLHPHWGAHNVSAAARPFLSACLIVRDEERNLSRCLNSLVGAVDEVVVVDTGSHDNTAALA